MVALYTRLTKFIQHAYSRPHVLIKYDSHRHFELNIFVSTRPIRFDTSLLYLFGWHCAVVRESVEYYVPMYSIRVNNT